MEIKVNHSTLELVEGDITRQDTEAIVNAANEALTPGGGVDGAITRAAGPEALEPRRKLGRCPTGEARIGPGGRLKARYIIYAVGPVYRGGHSGEAALLASAYRRSLELASQNGIRSIAFPAISTGVYGYPMAEAAQISLQTVIDYLRAHPEIELVRFVLFGQAAYDTFAHALETIHAGQA